MMSVCRVFVVAVKTDLLAHSTKHRVRQGNPISKFRNNQVSLTDPQPAFYD
jgi:hypothetical protein